MPNYILVNLLNNEFTYREFLQELIRNNKASPIPVPLIPKVLELLSRDEWEEDFLPSIQKPLQAQFMQMAFGNLDSAEKALLFIDIYKDLRSDIDIHVRQEEERMEVEYHKYIKESSQVSYKDILEAQ